MKINTREEIRRAMAKIPESLQDYIDSPETTEKRKKIATDNKLTIEQSNTLADENSLLMMGLTSTKEYIPNIKERLGITSELAGIISNDVNEKIFKPVRELLLKVQQQKQDQSVETAPSIVPIRTTQIPVATPKPIIPASPITQTPQVQPKYGIAPEMLGKKDDLEITSGDSPEGFVADKLTSIVKLPKEQKFVSAFENKPKPGYDKGDPYREPIE